MKINNLILEQGNIQLKTLKNQKLHKLIYQSLTTKETIKSINKIQNKFISTQIPKWKHLWKLKLPSSTSFWAWRLEHQKIKLGNKT